MITTPTFSTGGEKLVKSIVEWPKSPLQAVSPGLLPVLGVIFGLFVAFTAAQVWSDNDRAGAAVSREASALRSIVLLAAGLPAEQESRLRGLVRRYIEQVVSVEWPTMADQTASLRPAAP